MHDQEPIPHLFRTEFSKISSVLTRLFGIGYMEVAEDIASETFLAALETWPYKGMPKEPVAWLYAVAKNKTINHLKRNKLLREKIIPEIKIISENDMQIDLTEENISDSMLQMLFTVCHPAVPAESQIALSLRILCGFSVEEIATAFLTNKETINKRLYRAKERLRQEKIQINHPDPVEFEERLDAVLMTIYLLFSEGYYSESHEKVIREELCVEAMRLMQLLMVDERSCPPRVNALYALMCFQASRLRARQGGNGEMILYEQQDESLWDQELITRGGFYLHKSSTGDTMSKYHLEAAIAYWHTQKQDSAEKWDNILHLYNLRLKAGYSPVAALNRTYALSKVRGKEIAIAEAEKLDLVNNHFYYVLLADLYGGVDNDKSKKYLETAAKLAKNSADQKMIQRKLQTLKGFAGESI